MIEPRNAARLLRKAWESPSALARELYELATSPDVKDARGPAPAITPIDRPGIKVARPELPRPPAQAQAYESARRIPTPAPTSRPAAPRPPEQVSRPQDRPTPRPTDPTLDARPDRTDLPRANLAPDLAPRRDPFVPYRQAAQDAPGRPDASGPAIARFPVPEPARRPIGPADVAFAARPYQSPPPEVAGGPSLGPVTPIQPDALPDARPPVQASYDPMTYNPGLTPIKREANTPFWFGIVQSVGVPEKDGLPIYKVDLYPWPEADVEGVRVEVKMWGLNPLLVLKKGYKLWPVIEADNGGFFALPMARAKVARVTVEVTARSTTTPGTGKAQLYTRGTTTMAAGPTGDIDVFSIGGVPSGGGGKIPVGTWVEINEIDGDWWVVAADCSGAA